MGSNHATRISSLSADLHCNRNNVTPWHTSPTSAACTHARTHARPVTPQTRANMPSRRMPSTVLLRCKTMPRRAPCHSAHHTTPHHAARTTHYCPVAARQSRALRYEKIALALLLDITAYPKNSVAKPCQEASPLTKPCRRDVSAHAQGE